MVGFLPVVLTSINFWTPANPAIKSSSISCPAIYREEGRVPLVIVDGFKNRAGLKV